MYLVKNYIYSLLGNQKLIYFKKEYVVYVQYPCAKYVF